MKAQKGYLKTLEAYLINMLSPQYTPPEWAEWQKLWPEKWYTTYCQGPLGEPKNTFDQIWELHF